MQGGACTVDMNQRHFMKNDAVHEMDLYWSEVIASCQTTRYLSLFATDDPAPFCAVLQRVEHTTRGPALTDDGVYHPPLLMIGFLALFLS